MCDAGFVDFGGNVEFYVTLGVEDKMEKHLFFGHVGDITRWGGECLVFDLNFAKFEKS